MQTLLENRNRVVIGLLIWLTSSRSALRLCYQRQFVTSSYHHGWDVNWQLIINSLVSL